MQITAYNFISASFVPSLLVGYRKVYSVRCEADCRYDISYRTGDRLHSARVLDHLIVFHEVSLRRTLRSYFDYYHKS